MISRAEEGASIAAAAERGVRLLSSQV